MKKNYTIIAHALHSRLQLIRNKLDAATGMHPSEMVTRNQRYFEKAGESVDKHHNYQCDRSDYFDAAELFLMTVETENVSRQPIWESSKLSKEFIVEAYHNGDKRWYSLSGETLSTGLHVDTGPMTFEAASKLHAHVCKLGHPSSFRIVNCKQQK